MEEWYAALEEQFKVEGSLTAELRHLCDADGNEELPIHSWYNLKEAFSSQFPVWIVRRLRETYGFNPSTALDPFAGGGTSLLALSQLGIDATGVEYNPFIAWAAKVKSLWRTYDVTEAKAALESLGSLAPPRRLRMNWPLISSFKTTKYFRKNDVRVLLHTLARISDLDVSFSTKQLLRTGVAATIDEVSNLRKDGRALRHVRKPYRPTAEVALENRWRIMLDQLSTICGEQQPDKQGECCVWLGSALDLSYTLDPWYQTRGSELSSAYYDLVLYSPPYLNNFDYSEIYKLELWLLGFLEDYSQWRTLRRGTVRSHHSIKFPVTAHLAEDPRMNGLSEKIHGLAESRYLKNYAQENMPPIILGYFDDMYIALREQHRVLKPGGFLVYMIANSRHSELPIATDVVLGEIARRIGFEPVELIVVHKRNGRTKKKRFLRERV